MLTLGSSSAIVAHNLAALGSRVGFQSRIGDDPLGQIAMERLQQSGVDVSLVRRVPGSTTTGFTVILHHEAWRNILTYSGTIAETSWQDLDLDYLADSRHFHFSSYLPAARIASEAGRTLSISEIEGTYDFSRHQRRPRRQVGRWPARNPAPGRRLPAQRNAKPAKRRVRKTWTPQFAKLSQIAPLVVVKLGPKGAMAQRGAERVIVESREVVPVDTVGAGDSFRRRLPA